MKRAIAIVMSVGLALGLAACGGPGGSEADPSEAGYNEWIRMDDGRVVYCYITGVAHGGPSCDWANAK